MLRRSKMVKGAVKCSECGATVDVSNGKLVEQCPYCGTYLEYDDGVVRTDHTERYVDEAKIRELELEYAEDKEIRDRLQKDKRVWWKDLAIIFGLLFAMMIIGSILEKIGII
jgi:predicted RNA-binding Zn-ribbon protein involved in translation (DUF1610 family)